MPQLLTVTVKDSEKESFVPNLGRPTLDFIQGPHGFPDGPSGNFILEIACQIIQLNLCFKNRVTVVL